MPDVTGCGYCRGDGCSECEGTGRHNAGRDAVQQRAHERWERREEEWAAERARLVSRAEVAEADVGALRREVAGLRLQLGRGVRGEEVLARTLGIVRDATAVRVGEPAASPARPHMLAVARRLDGLMGNAPGTLAAVAGVGEHGVHSTNVPITAPERDQDRVVTWQRLAAMEAGTVLAFETRGGRVMVRRPSGARWHVWRWGQEGAPTVAETAQRAAHYVTRLASGRGARG